MDCERVVKCSLEEKKEYIDELFQEQQYWKAFEQEFELRIFPYFFQGW